MKWPVEMSISESKEQEIDKLEMVCVCESSGGYSSHSETPYDKAD